MEVKPVRIMTRNQPENDRMEPGIELAENEKVKEF